MKIRIYRKHKDVPLPERKSPQAAGLDLYAAEDFELWPGQVVLVSTGLIIEAPKGYFYKIHMRSGLAVKHGICLANDVGIIDEDYCGPADEVRVALVRLYNPRDEKVNEALYFKKGTRIAQIIFERNALPQVEWEEMDKPGFAGDSRGGFGSTGMN